MFDSPANIYTIFVFGSQIFSPEKEANVNVCCVNIIELKELLRNTSYLPFYLVQYFINVYL